MKILMMLSLLLMTPGALAAERVIRLADGSQIVGNVVSMQNDSFTVKTHALGTVTIKASDILSMTKPGKAPAQHQLRDTASGGQTSSAPRKTVQSIQSSIAGNSALMADILRLQNDPKVKAVLADPQLMSAVKNFDLGKLEKDPRIKALMNDPAIKKIQGGLH